MQRTRVAGLGGLLVVLVLALGAVWSFPRVEAHFIARAQKEGQSTLRLVADAVDQAVGRYAPMPALIASDPALPALLRSPENQGLVPFVNEKLRLTAASIGASDVYVMDASGRTVAASNYRLDTSFIGRSFEFRPYFTRALAGEAAQFHALGTTSGERGFFFAAPVLDGIEVLGVLAVKITVGDFEEAWAGSGREIIVADANGIAFMASRSDYRMRALAPLSDGTLARIADTRQFPLGSVTPIPFSADVIATGAVEVTLGAAGDGERFLAESQSLALAGWHAVVLTPLALIRSEAVRVMLIWGLVATALLLAALVVFERRARLLDRMRV
ncbi:MAG: cache domain-containing protein, partial [Pseudomonadota bacterium]